MKNLITLALLSITLVGCGSGSSSNDDTTPPPIEETPTNPTVPVTPIEPSEPIEDVIVEPIDVIITPIYPPVKVEPIYPPVELEPEYTWILSSEESSINYPEMDIHTHYCKEIINVTPPGCKYQSYYTVTDIITGQPLDMNLIDQVYTYANYDISSGEPVLHYSSTAAWINAQYYDEETDKYYSGERSVSMSINNYEDSVPTIGFNSSEMTSAKHMNQRAYSVGFSQETGELLGVGMHKSRKNMNYHASYICTIEDANYICNVEEWHDGLAPAYTIPVATVSAIIAEHNSKFLGSDVALLIHTQLQPM